MWNNIYYFVMVPMVYLAFATLAVGLAFKCIVILSSKGIRGTRAVYPKGRFRLLAVLKDALLAPMAFGRDKVFWFFIMAFHISFFLLIIGHLELIREFAWIQAVPHRVMLGAGFVGITLILSTLYFLLRRFASPWREISVPEDYLILLLLFLTMIFGSHMSLASRYGIAGFDIDVSEYRKYLGSLVAFRPVVPGGITGSPHYVIVALHVFFANLVLMLFPFSKMIHSVFTFIANGIKRK